MAGTVHDLLPPSLPNIDFGNLFAFPEPSTNDHDFFMAGFTPFEHEPTPETTNDFSFDQLVNLEACQPQPPDDTIISQPNTSAAENNINPLRPSLANDLPSSKSFYTIVDDLEHQLTAHSSGKQPLLGASA